MQRDTYTQAHTYMDAYICVCVSVCVCVYVQISCKELAHIIGAKKPQDPQLAVQRPRRTADRV